MALRPAQTVYELSGCRLDPMSLLFIASAWFPAALLIAQFFESQTRIPGPADPPRTNYEAKYRAEGREIFEVRFRKSLQRAL